MDKERYRERIVKKYGAGFVASLGKHADRTIAASYKLSNSTVARIRVQLGIPALTVTNPMASGVRKQRVVVVLPGTVLETSVEEALERFRQIYMAMRAAEAKKINNGK